MNQIIKYIFLLFISVNIISQISFAQDYQAELVQEAIDSVDAIFNRLPDADNDKDMLKLNGYIKSYMDFILNEDDEFDLDIDTLGNLSVLISPNGKLRVVTWNLQMDDGSNKYYGYLHYKHKKNAEVFHLEDFSNDTSSLHTYKSHKEWYGALYYDIIEKTSNKQTHYILLGWDGADYLINRKVVESLEFSRKNLPEFGIKIFKEDRLKKGRLIYEYAENSTMILRYNEKQDIIVLDHLVPVDPRFKNIRHYYGPDFSYDSFEYRMGKWYLVENIDPNIAINFKKNRGINTIKNQGSSTNF